MPTQISIFVFPFVYLYSNMETPFLFRFGSVRISTNLINAIAVKEIWWNYYQYLIIAGISFDEMPSILYFVTHSTWSSACGRLEGPWPLFYLQHISTVVRHTLLLLHAFIGNAIVLFCKVDILVINTISFNLWIFSSC